VEKALDLAHERPIATMADIGTGCGAIAVTLAVNLPETRIYATDISESALMVAFLNCQRYAVLDRVYLLQGDLVDPLPEPVDLMVANLPYVTGEEVSSRGLADFEPELALSGGQDGLAAIRRLCLRVGDKLRPEGMLLLEVGVGQSLAVASFLRCLYPHAEIGVTPDLGDIDRVVTLTQF
jgi:release factor glutamine methyltransferase